MRHTAILISLILWATPAPSQVTKGAAAVVVLKPGDDVAAAVASQPPGTTFHLTAGVYRLQQIEPQDGDIFTGETATILSGASVLSQFQSVGTLWVASNQTQKGQATGACAPGFDACMYPEDLFFDDEPLHRVATRAEVKAGSWFFDYAHQQIVFADNPSGHLVETSVARSAFFWPCRRRHD